MHNAQILAITFVHVIQSFTYLHCVCVRVSMFPHSIFSRVKAVRGSFQDCAKWKSLALKCENAGLAAMIVALRSVDHAVVLFHILETCMPWHVHRRVRIRFMSVYFMCCAGRRAIRVDTNIER